MIEKNLKCFIAIFFLASFLFVQLGCDSSSDSSKGEVEEILFWNTMEQPEAELMPSIIADFEKEYPLIKVKLEAIDFYKAKAKFEESAKNNKSPDVMRADRFWLHDLHKKKLLVSIPEDKFKKEISDMIPIAKDVVTIDKKICAIPLSVDCLALFYNKSHFKKFGIKPPTNFDKFSEAAVKLTDALVGRYGFFVYPSGWYFEPFLFGFNGRYFSDNGKLIINSQQAKKAMEFLLRLKDSLKVVPPVNLRKDSYQTMIRSFKAGKISMIFCGPWAIRDILSGPDFKNNQLNLGIAPIPSGPSGFFTPVGCQNLVVSSKSKHKSAAMKFVKYMYSVKIQTKLAKVNYGLPVRKSVFNDPELSRDPYLSTFIYELKTSKIIKIHPLQGSVYEPIGYKLKNVFNGDISPDYALSDLEKEWNAKH